MYISKSRFINWTRCPMYFPMELKHNPSGKHDIDIERERRMEMLEELKVGVMSAEYSESDEDESFIAEPSEELEALLPYYNQVEDEALQVAKKYFHGTFVSDSKEVHNQKLFEYEHNGHTYRCYVDIYNENENEINIIEVKATTNSKYMMKTDKEGKWVGLMFSDVPPKKRGGNKYPLFVKEGSGIKEEIPSMPGQFRFSIDELLKEVDGYAALGLKSILLFGIPDMKDEMASSAYDDDGIIQRAVRALKARFPELYVITDVCLCEYMSHGHCGILKDGEVDNDATLELLAKTALSHAIAGADMVAPSDMMDGRVAAIREKLDENGFKNTPIMSYSAKFASAYYGPFREAAGSAPQCGNRKGYQMDVRNGREALREVELDLEEGADIVMVKPGLAFLDVLRQTAEISDVPVAVYNVSGEYAMVKAAANLGLIDEDAIIRENLLAFKRAGADIIITYHAKEALEKGLL